MKNLLKFIRGAVGLLLFVLMAGMMSAYDTTKDSSDVYVVVWEPGTVAMQIKMPTPASPLIDGSTTYETPLLAAMKSWNDHIGVVQLMGQVAPGETYVNGNGLNEVVMDSKADGEDFGENTLAITLSYRLGNVRTESDVVFNTAYTWDSYRGAQRNALQDIQRVAVHEFGHVLGLTHPNEATPPQAVTAIMNSTLGRVELPQADDLNGARSLYGEPGSVPANDAFANAATLTLSGSSAQAAGSNIGASAEPGEPDHAGESPARSVWWKWVATVDAPMTVTTFGSNFDTVVGIYTGSDPGSLIEVGSNDDEERGVIRSSKLNFASVSGTTYYISVDGWDASYGQINLNLKQGLSTGTPPVITTQPSSLSVPLGGAVTYRVVASGSPTGYQWYRNGSAMSGETAEALTFSAVTTADAANYHVVVTNDAGSTTSHSAALTILESVATSQSVTTGHEVTIAAPQVSGTYQWQVSLDGGTTWNNVSSNSTYSGVDTATLTISNVTTSFNGRRYRYTTTGAGGDSTGTAIRLTVNAALIPFPVAIAIDGSANLYVTDSSIHTVHKITSTNQVSTLAGTSGQTGTSDGESAEARFNQPSGIAVSRAGVVTVADTANAMIRRITSAGVVTTVAGSTTERGNADGSGASATFSMPIGIARDESGAFGIADATNHTVRTMAATYTVATLAGSSENSGSTDGAGANARFNYPSGVAFDAAGNLYVADTTNNTIRKITPSGVVSTLAGLAGVSGWEDGTGSGALFNQPGGLATDGAGNIYVADTGNSVIRKITPAGVVTTLAGLSTVGGLKDGVGGEAWFNQPRDVTVDGSGNIFVADTGNAAIRKITPSGEVTTLSLSVTVSGSTGGGTSTGGGSTGGGTVTTPGSSGGGGGGGGAPSLWFVGGVAFLILLRARSRRAA